MKLKRTNKPQGIILDEKFRIIPLDDQNIELQEYVEYMSKETNDKPSELTTSWSPKGYYHSTTSAIKAYCNLLTMRCKNIDELVETLNSINDKIDKLFNFEPTNDKNKNCKCQGKG